ncbi:MAG: BMC domain-containing protein [Emergencia sp.]|nr:BMC domain-containing protein [Emergencia sp.]
MEFQQKQRIIQEFVPGKQVTLAHLIANPQPGLYKKLGASVENSGALGILTITPSEGVIIAADVATKAGNVELIFVDRFSGTLVVCGDVMSVEAALTGVLETLCGQMEFSPTKITRT